MNVLKNNGVTAMFWALLSGVQFSWLYFTKDFSVGLSLLDAFGGYGLLFGIALAMRYGLSYYLPAPMRWPAVWIETALLALVWIYVFQWSFLFVYLKDNGYTRFFKDSIPERVLIGWVLLVFMSNYDYLREKLYKEEATSMLGAQTQQMKNEAELFKLRQQLHPHFLFNSLNSVSALIGINPDKSREMIQQLSVLLRKTLKKEDNQLLSIVEEIEDLQLYLAIEKVRFENRLIIHEEIGEDCLNQKIPPFLLQPLVENAIKFGLYGTLGEVVIRLKIAVVKDVKTNQDRMITFSITNPFDPTTVLPKGTGFGLQYIRRRLYLLFGQNDLLQTDHYQETGAGTAVKNNFFKVSLQIPLTPA